jgi:hypothetical protein
MPLYKFDYEYRARGSQELEFDSDDEARAYGWSHPEDVIDSFYDYDTEIDAEDVDIIRINEDGTEEYLYED